MAPSTAQPSNTPTAVATLADTNECAGFGRVPRAGQITIPEDNQLLAYSPSGGPPKCLINLESIGATAGNVLPHSWNAVGDRVLLDDRAISKDGSLTERLTDRGRDVAFWSRPTGTSVVYITTDGHLKKRSSFGGKVSDISFLARHDAVVYHPAGTHIATSGLAANGDYGLYLATNVGTDPQLIARGEEARFITNLYFGEDGITLYYSARHGPQDWHLHRVSIVSGTLQTIAKKPYDFEYSVSPFEGGLEAWFAPGDCAVGEPGTFHISGVQAKVSGLETAIPEDWRSGNIHPVGWLPDRQLVVRVASVGCGTAQPGDVYVLSKDGPILIDRENYGNVTVRAKLPPPPPPPGEEPTVVA